jgi:thioredoxin
MMYVIWLVGTAVGVVGGLALGRLPCKKGVCMVFGDPVRGAILGGIVGLLAGQGIAGVWARYDDPAEGLASVHSPEEFQRQVLESPVPTVVDFYSPTCPPCRMLAPVMVDLAGQVGDRARVVKVDVTRAQGLAREYGVRGVPTVIIFRQGQEVDRMVGYRRIDSYLTALRLEEEPSPDPNAPAPGL